MHSHPHFHTGKLRTRWNPARTPRATLLTALLLVFLLSGLTALPAQAQTYTVIHQFNGDDAVWPATGVTTDQAGNIYGTASGFPPLTNTSVFKLSRHQDWAFTSLHIFLDVGPNSFLSELAVRSDGVYGAITDVGNRPGHGIIYNMRPPSRTPAHAANTWIMKELYRFRGQPDADAPRGNLLFDSSGNIFGVATYGGSGCLPPGCGAVYELTPSDSGFTETVLYNFAGGPDGYAPYGGLVSDNFGNLYGTTYNGGDIQSGSGRGTVYRLSPSQNGWTETVLYRFQGGSDGGYPFDILAIDPLGNLYGTTSAGGANDSGTAFELSPANGGWTFNLLHDFDHRGHSQGGLVIDAAGNLYGGTLGGGQYGHGVLYKLSPSGGGWTYSVLHNFNGNDGSGVIGRLHLAADGYLYGTTPSGGNPHCPSGCGVVFQLMP